MKTNKQTKKPVPSARNAQKRITCSVRLLCCAAVPASGSSHLPPCSTISSVHSASEPCPLEEQTSTEYCFGGTHLVPQAELISVHCFQDMDNPCGALLIQGIL